METSLEFWDFLILGVYLLGIVGLGSYFAGGIKTSEDFFLAGRSFSWFPLGLSIIVSLMSANSFLGTPGYSYGHDLQMIAVSPLMLPIMLIVIYFFLPTFYRFRVTTAYEYLEQRLGAGSRLLATGLFLLTRTGWLGTVIYVPCVPLSRVAGISLELCVVTVGLGATLYTVLGGMKAVVWTDVIQFFVLIGGLLVMVATLIENVDGGALGIWEKAGAGGRTTLFQLEGDLFSETTIWAILIGSIAAYLADYGTDQVALQRYFSARSLRDSQRSLLCNAVAVIPLVLLLGAVGLGLFAFYQQSPEELGAGIEKDHVMVFFAATQLPTGFAGLMIAAIFAATMSSVDSGINSMSTACVVDIYRRWIRPPARTSNQESSPQEKGSELKLARVLTAFWGFVGTATALFVMPHAGSIVLMSVKVMGLFTGPLLGIFLLAFFTRKTRDLPCLAGALAGWSIGAYCAFATEMTFWWWSPLGCMLTIIVGWGLSVLISRPPAAQEEQAEVSV